jgi:hypothetical protein
MKPKEPPAPPVPSSELVRKTKTRTPEQIRDRKRRRAARAGLTKEDKTTRVAHEIREGKRSKKPPRPKNKSLAEIAEMDPDSDEFKHKRKNGSPMQPRRTGAITQEQVLNGEVSFQDAARADKQKRTNARRARARKGDAMAAVAVEVLEEHVTKDELKQGIFDEDKAIAEGILTLEDWDDEELIRGYRRNRDGRWGPPPKFIPREVQQQCFRTLVGRGDRKMREAYLASVQELVGLAHSADSEKVKLEAIREVMNRLVGKVPDRVHVATEQPWEGFLADSLVPYTPVEIGDEASEAFPAGEGVDHPALTAGEESA